MIKNYIIDTNVMVHDPDFFKNFEENNIIIPIICIEELDNLKKREGIVGYHARNAIREINKLQKLGNFSEGIKLPNGGIIRIELNHIDSSCLPNGLDINKNDNKILSVCKNLSKQYMNTVLVTKDLSMKIKADSIGINVEDYEHDKIDTDEIYKGYSNIDLGTSEINKIFNGGLKISDKIKDNIYPNHFFHIKNLEDFSNEIIAKFDGEKIVPLKYQNEHAWGLKPINMEQRMAFELLMDDNIHFVTLTGGAGSGKTILPTSVAIQKVIELNIYRKIIFVRPVVSAGYDIGYLPGSEIDKLRPWMGPFYDAIENLFNSKSKTDKDNNENSVEVFIDMFREKGVIETKTFTYMRGRTLSDALVIVDEAQQTTPHLAKLMLTRAGHGSKFVFVGDPSDNQIDNVLVDSKSNGLVYTVEKMKKFNITGHIRLKQVERSPLAKLAEKYM